MFMIRTAALLAAVITLPALADTKITYVDSKSGAPQTIISIKGGEIRIDDAGAGTWTLFDRRSGKLTTVDEAEKTYTVLDEEAMREVSGKMSSAMAEMRAQLEQMPPEQRAMMEKMMGGVANLGKSMLKVSVERTGNMLEKSGYDCEQVFLSVGSLSRTEMCVADPADIDIPADDRETLDAMTQQMKTFAENMSQGLGMDLSFDMDSLDGMPVYTQTDGEDSADILKGITHNGIDAGLFAIPAGYSEEAMDMEE